MLSTRRLLCTAQHLGVSVWRPAAAASTAACIVAGGATAARTAGAAGGGDGGSGGDPSQALGKTVRDGIEFFNSAGSKAPFSRAVRAGGVRQKP